MLWTLIVLLLIFWILGLAFKVAAGAIPDAASRRLPDCSGRNM